MIRHFYLYVWGIWAALVFLAGGVTLGQNTPAASPTATPNQHKPKLAVAVSAQEPNALNQENLEDLLMIELANQPFLQLVDRSAIHAVMKEHAIALSNLNDTKNVLTLGKFAGADFLLRRSAGKEQGGDPTGRGGHRAGEVGGAGRLGLRPGLVLGGDSRKGLGGPSSRLPGRQPSYRGHRRVPQPQRHGSKRQARHRVAEGLAVG